MRQRIIRHSTAIASASSLSFAAFLAIASRAEAQQPPPAKAIPVPPVTVITPDKAKPVPQATVKKPVAPKLVQQGEPAPQPTKPDKPKPVAASTPNSTPPPAVEAVAQEAADPAVAAGAIVNPNGPAVQQTTAGAVQGYRALSASSSTKTDTAIERLPQSVQVVPQEVIRDQSVLSVEEAARNVSNTQGTHRLQTPAYESSVIRGFRAEQWLDGMVVYYNAGDRDTLANIERIEVLKGPSAILYGGGEGAPVGGAINVISKLPTEKASGEVGLKFGSHNFVQPYFDVNQPISKDGTVLFRMTGEYTSANSQIDVLETERYSLNPTLTLTNKTDTKLTIQGRLTSWAQQEYQGLPATGTVAGGFQINRDLFIGPSDIPDSYSKTQGVTVTLDHRFNAYVDASIKARWSKSKFAEYAQSIVGADSFAANTPFFAPSTWALTNVYLYQEQDEVSVNPNVRVKFDQGPTKNTLLFGADYSRVSDKGVMTADFFLGGAGLVDLTAPSFSTPYVQVGESPFTTFFKPANIYETKGVYAQLQSSVAEKLHILAGVRLANVTIDALDPSLGVDATTDKTKVLPRIGAVYDVARGFSVYASYSEGLKANPFAIYNSAPEPEESTQKEAGIKFNLGNGLSGTAAIFEIERSKVPVTIGLGSDPIGEERSRGFETDVIWQPNANWQLIGSYGYVDAKLVKATPTTPAGVSLVGVPQHSGRLWVNYKFDPDILKGWSVGAGVYAASAAPIDLANTYDSDAYFTIDAKIAYESQHYLASLTVKNLSGEKYFTPYSYFGGRVAPGDDRALYGTIAYRY